jgi:putative endonuclease
MSPKEYFVYILRCSDGSYYTGITSKLHDRIEQHQSALDRRCNTSNKLPVELVYFEVFQIVQRAISREKQIKRWSRAKKEALISGDYLKLQALAESKKRSE